MHLYNFCYRNIRPHTGLEGDWTSYTDTTCDTGAEKTFITGVAIKTDHKQDTKIKTVFEDDRGATDLKMMCSNGRELTSTAAMLGKHRSHIYIK